jgi:hypothetical protein
MSKQRLALSLDDYSFNLISNISEDLGKTKSEVVIELMHLMGPALSHISSVKRMVDAGLKATGEEAFKGFLRGMQQDFDESLADAEQAFFEKTDEPGEGAEHMQAPGTVLDSERSQ